MNSALPGFDAEFVDLDHYIRVITHRIWEEGRIDDIRRYYSDPCIVETPSSVSTSIDDVIGGTKATLAMFPDRKLLAEDVICSGDADGGFLSSHRIVSPMTHTGSGNFGPATGKRIYVRTIADCVCKENRIIHEWLVRDHAAIALQIGSTPKDLAARWVTERGEWNKPVAGAAPPGYISHVSDEPTASHYAQSIRERALGAGREARPVYDRAIHHIGPGAQTLFGHNDVARFWQERFSALVVKSFSIEHLAFQSGDGRADRVAMRWRAQAVHEKQGVYGEPTGKNVEILGINHAEFVDGSAIREWVLIDDVALWMQVLAP